MTCQEFRESFEKEQNPEVAWAEKLHEHLEGCAECEEWFEKRTMEVEREVGPILRDAFRNRRTLN